MVDSLKQLKGEKMKKVIMTMLMFLFTVQTYAVEKDISFYVGHSNGGGSAGMQTIIQQELKNKREIKFFYG